ncbi:NUDIX domain-containing protein [Nocardioides oleivorans]|uniref:NUDIX domain-containing protein n=1 Tax=Nocardioides oleivorans TaxID=273676 RepID=A0A4Q2RNN6_9ACTN|nr:NUDIX domain-containing protein [Nocardioides oleivorans]RYB90046.1 NUDIX domain-containing protein [Nocardioides oleivorans]
MSQAPDRAVCVAFDGDSVLVIARQQDGRAYCVLPGGGVEPGETPEVAVLRELAEETGLIGTVKRLLWTVEHHDRRAHYFLVAVEPGSLDLGGPEASVQSSMNAHTPTWLPLGLLEAEGLQPASMRERLRAVTSEAT